MREAGIERLAVYVSRLYVDQKELALVRGWSPEKVTVGLGIERMSVPDNEDNSVTMAVNALKKLDFDPKDIGRLVVATETGIDYAKPISAFLHECLELPSNTEIFEIKHACVSGAYALEDALNWIRTGQNNGKSALVVCTDTVKYERCSMAEPTHGAGAVSLLVSENPELIEFNLQTGTYSKNVYDFWKPLDCKFARVNGKFSLECYTAALYEAYADFARKGEANFDYLVFHTPFPRLVEKTAKMLAEENKDLKNAMNEIQKTLSASRIVGNIFTGSIFLSLASLLETNPNPGKLGMLCYGSGCSAKVLAGRIKKGTNMHLREMLEAREKISVEEYDRLTYGISVEF